MSDEDLIRRGDAIQLMARVYAARTRIKDALEELHAMPAVVPGGWLSFDSAPRDVLAEAEEMADMLLKQHDAFSGRAADTIHTLLAIIAGREAWQPIATVPMDGSRVDLWSLEGQRICGCNAAVYDLTKFSHWMRAPKPPALIDKGAA